MGRVLLGSRARRSSTSFFSSRGGDEGGGSAGLLGGGVPELSIHTLHERHVISDPPKAWDDMHKRAMWRLPKAWIRALSKLKPAKVCINGVIDQSSLEIVLHELQKDPNLREAHLGYLNDAQLAPVVDMTCIVEQMAALARRCPRLERLVLYVNNWNGLHPVYSTLTPDMFTEPTVRMVPTTLRDAGDWGPHHQQHVDRAFFVLSLASDTLPASLVSPSWSAVRGAAE